MFGRRRLFLLIIAALSVFVVLGCHLERDGVLLVYGALDSTDLGFAVEMGVKGVAAGAACAAFAPPFGPLFCGAVAAFTTDTMMCGYDYLSKERPQCVRVIGTPKTACCAQDYETHFTNDCGALEAQFTTTTTSKPINPEDQAQKMIEKIFKEMKKFCKPENICPQCGRFKCVEHYGHTAGPCCLENYQLKCCYEETTTTPITTTTTPKEPLLCKQAMLASYPNFFGYQEKDNKICPPVYSIPDALYCFVLNCTTGMNSEQYLISTEWGCTGDKLGPERNFRLRDDRLLYGRSWRGFYDGSKCSYFVGGKNVDFSNNDVKIPIHGADVGTLKCKQAYFADWFDYYQTSDQFCSRNNQRFCYVLNCTAVNGITNQTEHDEFMTEWGCTDDKYKAHDFMLGKGRAFGEAYLGAIPNGFACNSFIGEKDVDWTNDIVGLLLPVNASATKTSENLHKCKRAIKTKQSDFVYEGDCLPGEQICYFLSCSSVLDPDKYVKEWGCTKNVTKICAEKAVEFGFAQGRDNCYCFVGPTNENIDVKETMKMKASDIDVLLTGGKQLDNPPSHIGLLTSFAKRSSRHSYAVVAISFLLLPANIYLGMLQILGFLLSLV